MLGLLSGLTSGGLNTGGSLTSMLTRLVTRALGMLTGILWGGLRTLFTVTGRILTGGFDLLKTLFRKGFDALWQLGKVALVGFGAAIGGTVVAVQKAIEKLKTAGNAISDIRGATGLGSRAAGGIFRRFSAYGLPTNLSDTNPYAMQAQAGAWGLPGIGSRGFIPALAGKYQNSDPFMARYMLQSMELDSPEMRRRLMTPVGMLREQENFSDRVQSGLGIDPVVIERLTQRTELLGLKFKVLGEGILMKLAEVALPRLLAIGERLVNVLGARSGQIGDMIVAGVEKGFQALLRVGEFILRLPEYFFALSDSVLNFAEIALKAVPLVWELFLRGVAFVQDALGNLINLAQGGFSHLTDLAQLLSAAFVGAGQTVQAVWQQIEGPMQSIFDHILTFLEKIAEAAPTIIQIMGVLGKIPAATGDAGQKIAEAMGGNQSQGAFGWLVGALAGGAMLKKAPGWLWNLGKGALGFGGAEAATTATGAAVANPGMWAKFLASPVARYGGIALRSTLNMVGAGGLVDIAGGAATGAAGAGAGGAAAGALRGGVSGLLRNPYVAGIGLGLIGYNTLQQRGWLPGNPASLEQMAGYAWDHTLGGLFSGGDDSDAGAGMPGKQTPKSPFSGFNFHMPSLGSLATMSMNALGGINTNPANSTWATALDERFGPMVQGFSDNGMAQIDSMRKRLDEARGRYDADALIAELRKLGGKMDEQTKYAKETAEGVQGVNDRAAGYAMWRYAKESSAALRRQS